MGRKSIGLLACALAAGSALQASTACAADEFQTPAVSVVRVDWRAASEQLRAEIAMVPGIAPDFAFAQRGVGRSDPRSFPALVQLNALTSAMFSGISRSPVPVLLPFDAAAFAEARQRGEQARTPPSHYQADFRLVDFFDAGPSGYDAVFTRTRC